MQLPSGHHLEVVEGEEPFTVNDGLGVLLAYTEFEVGRLVIMHQQPVDMEQHLHEVTIANFDIAVHPRSGIFLVGMVIGDEPLTELGLLFELMEVDVAHLEERLAELELDIPVHPIAFVPHFSRADVPGLIWDRDVMFSDDIEQFGARLLQVGGRQRGTGRSVPTIAELGELLGGSLDFRSGPDDGDTYRVNEVFWREHGQSAVPH